MPTELPQAVPGDLQPSDLPMASPSDLQPVQAQPAGPVKRLLGNFWDKTQLNPITGLKNLYQAVRHPMDTLETMSQGTDVLAQKAKDAWKQGNYIDAGVHALNSAIPFLGPGIDAGAEQIRSGDVAGGIGSALGIGTTAAAPVALGKIVGPAANMATRSGGKLAQYMMTRAVGKGMLPEEAATAAGTLLKERIPLTDVGRAKLQLAKEDAGQQIGAIYDKAPSEPTIAPEETIQGLNQLRQVPFSDTNAIDKVQGQFETQITDPSGKMTPQQAFQTKVAAQNRATLLRKNAYSGQANPDNVASLQTVASTLGDQLVKQFPEVSEPNARYAAISAVQPVVDKIVKQSANRLPWSVGLGGGLIKGATFGGAGIAEMGLRTKMLLSPAVKAQLALAISKGSNGTISYPVALFRITAMGNEAQQDLARAHTDFQMQGNSGQ